MTGEIPTSTDEKQSDCAKTHAVIAAARTVVEITNVYDHELLPTPLIGALVQLRQRLDEL